MWIFWTIIAALVVLLAISIYLNIKMGKIVLKVQDSIEDSLDILDERYASISKVLEIPLFYDSAEIRSVLDDVKDTRESILDIARSLTTIDEAEFTIDDPNAGDVVGKES
jgi:nitrate reductase NapAB chaperone NapD